MYPLHIDPPPPCPLVVFTGVSRWACVESFEFTRVSGPCRFLPVCSSLPFSVRQGSKEGCNLYSSREGEGFESPCYLTASPPIPLPIYGATRKRSRRWRRKRLL